MPAVIINPRLILITQTYDMNVVGKRDQLVGPTDRSRPHQDYQQARTQVWNNLCQRNDSRKR